MNKKTLIFISVIAALIAVGGYLIGYYARAGHKDLVQPNTATLKPLYWASPMDPGYRSDKPGKSPMGMDLIPVYASDTGTKAAADIHIVSAVVNDLGVRVAEVRQGTLAHTIEAVGYVGYDENTLTAIHTRADGWIEKLAINSVGDRVRAGQLLYRLFSPKLATAEREYLIALAGGNHEMITASAERLRSLGFTDSQVQNLQRTRRVQDRVARYASGSGVVVELGVREGAYVMPATSVMKLADLGSAWILVEVDESDAALLAKGQKASADLDAFPGHHWDGTVDYIYPDLDPVTRTAKVRLQFANPGERLRPNMYAHVSIQAAPHTNTVYIPTQALIRTGQSQRVIVALGGGNFDVCPVVAGYESGNEVEILKGLRLGQHVVTSAQFMLDSEANLDAAALRMGVSKPGCSQAPTASPSPDNSKHKNSNGDHS